MLIIPKLVKSFFLIVQRNNICLFTNKINKIKEPEDESMIKLAKFLSEKHMKFLVHFTELLKSAYNVNCVNLVEFYAIKLNIEK